MYGALRDLGTLGVGVWILLFKQNPSSALIVVGVACLGVTGSGVAQRILERVLANGRGNDRR